MKVGGLAICLSILFTNLLYADAMPVPRFAALRAKAVNTHVGPGNTYPIEWRFERQYLPVEIVAEFDMWRQIRDPEGMAGWVHRSLLTGKRYVMILKKNRKLYNKPDIQASVVAVAEPGTVGKLIECRQDWCQVNIQGSKGWVKRRFIFGVYPHEEKVR